MTFITTPIGRIFAGSLWTGQTTGYQNKPLVDRNGNPKVEFYIGLALPKGPEFDAFWQQVATAAQGFWPQGQSQQQGFSWKIKDGDAPDQIAKDGRPGHWVLNLSSGFPPAVYDQAYVQLIDPMSVTPGDYARVNLSVASNSDVQKPGVYLNLGMTLFMQKGVPIVSGPSPQEVFGPPQPGAVAAQPVAGAPPAAAPVAAQAPPVGAVPVAAQPVATAPPVAAQPVAGAVPVAAQPVAGAVPGAPPAAAQTPPMPGQPAATAVPGAVQPGTGFLTPGQQ